MSKKLNLAKLTPVLFSFFVMGFVDIDQLRQTGLCTERYVGQSNSAAGLFLVCGYLVADGYPHGPLRA